MNDGTNNCKNFKIKLLIKKANFILLFYTKLTYFDLQFILKIYLFLHDFLEQIVVHVLHSQADNLK